MSTLQIQMPPKLIPALAPELGTYRYRVFRGGRASGKSFNVAKMAAVYGCIDSLRILCTRELQNSIKESFHAELKNAIESCSWLSSQYDVGVDFIRHVENGTEFIFKGLRSNISAVKSMAQINLLIVEEAETVPHASWIDLLPTIRAPKSEIFIIYNPKSPNSWVAETFGGSDIPPRTIIVDIHHSDNPYFSEVLQEQRQYDKIHMPESLYNHIWEGQYLLDDDTSVIKIAWVLSAIDAHHRIKGLMDGHSVTGYDIADDGKDKCATVTRTGSVAIHVDEWQGKEDEILKSCTRAHKTAIKYGASIVYDSIGVGASAGGKFNELNATVPSTSRVRHSGFNAGAAVIKPNAQYGMSRQTNKDFFSGQKSQFWWMVADRFRNTHQVIEALNAGIKPPEFKSDELISIDSSIPFLEQLKMELCTPLRDFDNNGRVKVESKKDLAKRDVPSPNIADAFIMAYAPVRSGLKISKEVASRA